MSTRERPQVRRERAQRGTTAKCSSRAVRSAARVSPSRPDGRRRARRRGARESKREGPTTQRRLHVNKIAARWAGGPNGSSQRCREQEVPRASLRNPHVPSPGDDSETPVWRRRGWGSTLHAPPLTHSRSERGRARVTKTLDPQSEGASAGVPDISLGSLSPLRGGREGDDTSPATLALLGSRRSGSWLLAGAARCRPNYSPAAVAAAAAAAAAAEAGPARAPARSLRPSPQRVQAAARG